MKNTLNQGRIPARYYPNYVDVCRCWVSAITGKLMKCDPCREEDE